MEFRQLETFVRVAWEGSFSKAAIVMDITQPSVTARISGLETSLGRRLFDRRGNQIQLTLAGRRLLPYAERLMSLAGEVRELLAVDDSLMSSQSVLRVGCNTTSSCELMPSLIQRFRKLFPDARVVLEVERTAGLMPLLMEGSVEIAVVNPRLSHYLVDRLWEYTQPCMFVVNSEHELAGQVVSAATLKSIPWIAHTIGHETDELRRLSGFLGEELPIVVETNSSVVVRALVRDKQGAALLPQDAVRADIENGLLAEVRTADFDIQPNRATLVRWRRRPLTPAAAAFVQVALAMQP